MPRPMSISSFLTHKLCLVPLSLLFVACTVSSCGKDAGCNVFGAENYNPDAVIDDGSCIEVRDKFLGLYSVGSDCIEGSYLRSISETSDRFVVEVSNIEDTLGAVLARVSGENITIDQQVVRNSVTVEGAGVFVADENALSLTIRIRDSRSGIEVIHDCVDYCVKN